MFSDFDALMCLDIDALRIWGRRYRWLAEQQTDLNERQKFLAYAAIYDEFLACATTYELATRRKGGDSLEQASAPELKNRAA
jgi:hypothetical protein